MTLTEILTKFGLEEKEAKVYLALLELGQASVMQIAQKAAIKRPTTYIVLDALGNKGFVMKTYKKKKLLFVAEQPEALLRSIHQKETLLNEALPELQAIMATTKTRPKISIHEGVSGMRQVYNKIFASKEIRWFSSIQNVKQHFAETLAEMERISKSKKLNVYDLIMNTPDDLAYGKAVQSDHHQVRMMPKGLPVFIDSSIFDDNVAILSVKKDLFAVVIESKDVADSFRSLHALAWKSALPLKKVKSK